ncbi:serine/threonine-protein kinase [Kitasatospora sp. NPDC051170]|uniref:serine/threonine-protein kinase n=1 Tax=Kitasatospora sp. NPDC051170 TaxID=3364056 RepID=UPI00378B65BF
MRPLREGDPAEVGPYRVLGELGRGGMGRVLLGAAPDGRLAAVKQVHERYAADDGFRARFRREVGASRRVSGAYTAAVLDADTEAATPWLASVFVVGPSLGAAVSAAGALPAEVVHRLAVGLATALVEIHRVGLIHRDLKPENVLLAEDGVRVIDFGIARAVGDDGDLTHTGGVIGSPAYMSPEQAEGRALTPASDVFSLGSLLALALCGRSPFEGTSTFQTLYNVVHAEPDLADVPAATRPLLAACLAKDPAARPTPARLLELLGPVAPTRLAWPPAVHARIAEQQRAVDALLGAAPEPVRVPDPPTLVDREPPAPRRTRRTRRRAALAAVAVAVVVAGLGVGGYLLADGGGTDAPVVADKYLKAPVCEETVARLPLPEEEHRAEEDRYDEKSETADTQCTWYTGTVQTPSATVRWELRRSAGATENATRVQKQDFADAAEQDKVAGATGPGDESFWDRPGNGETCSLAVRDGNLRLWVGLGGPAHPEKGCREQATAVARAALEAMPR